MWRTLWSAGQLERASEFLSSDYTEHSLLVPNGLQGFVDYHSQRREHLDAVPDEITDPVVTIIAEGDYVGVATVEYYYEPDDSGDTYTSTRFDLFRIEDGLIAEHWDSGSIPFGAIAPDAAIGPAPIKGLEGHDQFVFLDSDDEQLANNKRLAFDLWRHTSEAGREEMALLYLDPIYIQHNPNAATGRQGFMDYFAQRPDTSIETYYERPLIAVVAEGNLVMQALKGERRNPNNPDEMVDIAWFDMFRIENGRIYEHWDNAAKGEVPRIMEDTFVRETD
jgi:predicted SnoaL-like aldol condensation-catalyzing enzyme